MKQRIHKIKIIALIIVVSVFPFTQSMFEKNSIVSLLMQSFGIILLIIGAFGRAWASAYISGFKNKKLITTGPYSISRNPLYFFSFLSFFGAGLVFRSILLTFFFTLLFFIMHWPTILQEERKLKRIFGRPFESYMDSVARFFPKSLEVEHPKIISFSSKHFTKAIMDCSLILSVIFFANILEWLHLHSLLPILYYLP
ncbi:MAG: isoprenylcysteine carboxylmethyltransferase family protein [Candidatus Cloacimonadota bacterium]|nr:isoprenylcysteine carboxylmethyltransferase family protein [Candidatus Cloacimonadota bacterium]